LRRFDADPKPAGLWEAARQMAQYAPLIAPYTLLVGKRSPD
jgi:hypothetical protein